MKVLFNWLKEFVPLEISAQEAVDALERLGFEIAAVQNFSKNLSGVVCGEVKDVRKHPNADRLSLCTVSDGQGQYDVICGAPNVRAGIRVPFARVGAVLTDGRPIAAAKLRGVDSQGMICSAEELGLEETSDGILILDAQAPIGADIKTLLNLDDTLIEIEVTPNRRDALSVLGIARELAAGLNLPLKNPEPHIRELELADSVAVSNEAPELCLRYIARHVRDVRVGPSPEWMVRRLARCGFRSINNLVDITNYVMIELGQPLHVFDASKIRGRRLRIRPARPGESLRTLEGKTVELEEGMLVIADEEKPAALAGVMGGEISGVTPDTREIVLESAAFQPATIRATSRKLGLSTESSYRFERGNDWQMVATASARAAQLIQELAGGLGFKSLETPTKPYMPTAIKLRLERARQFLGTDFKEANIAGILRRLGCIISMGSGQLLVTVPPWRLDLANESDLMEEIARVMGYENIPLRSPAIRVTTVPDDLHWKFQCQAAKILEGLGLCEAFNFSLISPAQAAFFIPGFGQSADARPIELSNALSQEMSLLRTSLLPGLFQSALTNFHRQVPGVRLYEFGRVFCQNKEGIQEVRRLGLLLAGTIQPPYWRQKGDQVDFYAMLGLLEAFFTALRIPSCERRACTAPALHPKRSALLTSGGSLLGWMGELHPQLLETLDTREPIVAAELDVAGLMQASAKAPAYSPPSVFPPVHRDLSFVIAEALPYEKVEKSLHAAAGSVLESCRLIDLYRGGAIGAGKKSLTVSLVFRHCERTLTDAEVEKVMEKIKSELQKKCEAVIRQ
jgi:phenylalanyl-tRNA synthetase beta chain